MEDCVVCCVRAVYICKPCNGAFCKEHKVLHEKSKIKVHNFEEIGISLDSGSLDKIVENLTFKINKVKEFKERIAFETCSLILKIEELCKNSLETADEKIQYYINLFRNQPKAGNRTRFKTS